MRGGAAGKDVEEREDSASERGESGLRFRGGEGKREDGGLKTELPAR